MTSRPCAPGSLEAADVARALGFAQGSRAWRYVEELATQDDRARLAPLEAAAARGVCEKLGLPDEDTDEIVSTLPTAADATAWWWCVARASARLVDDIGAGRAPRGTWPDFTGGPGVDPRARCHPFHVALAVVPHTLAYHRRHGVAGQDAWGLLGDVAHHAGVHRRVHGATGLNAWWWVTITLCGEMFQLGRLQYHCYRIGLGDESPPWYDDAESERRGDGFRRKDACLAVHIPATGSLDPALVDESLRAAATFFARHYPPPGPQRRRIATCRSWLLDPQLADHLAPSSRIVSFQRRFELVETSTEPGDKDVLEFVFHAPPDVDLDTLPQDTALERAVVAHLRSGGHWYRRTGWLELPSP